MCIRDRTKGGDALAQLAANAGDTADAEDQQYNRQNDQPLPVSYTHLTLPTSDLV